MAAFHIRRLRSENQAVRHPFSLDSTFFALTKIFLKKYLHTAGIVGNITELSDAGAKDNNTGC